MLDKEKNQIIQEDCFLPESDNAYPLCIGQDLEKCKTCSLWKDLPGPYDNM